MRHPIATQGLIIWLAMLGVSFYNFQPLLVGAFVTQLHFSETQAGLVATSNLLGVCLALTVFSFRTPQWNKRTLLIAALLLMGFSNLISVFTHTFHALVAVRFMTGIGEGVLGAVATSSIVLFRKPDRLYALIMVMMSLYGMVGILLLPQVLEQYGLAGVFGTLGVLCLISLPLQRLLPEPKAGGDHSASGVFPLLSRPQVLLVLLSIMLVYVSCNGVWSYYERIGTAIGVKLEDIGVSLSLGLFASLIGGIMAAVLSDRFGRMLPIAAGLVLAVFSMVTLYYAAGFTAYTASVMLLFGATGFVVPYYMGTLASFDPSGRLPVVGVLSLDFGNFIGPAVAANMVQPGDYSLFIVAAGFLFAIALTLVWASFHKGLANSPVLIPQG